MVSHLIGGGLLARPKMNAGVAELATLRVLSGVEHDVGLAIVELAMLRLRRLLHLELGWFDEVRAELVSVTKAELEQVDLDEGHQYEARDGQVEHAESRTLTSASLMSHMRFRPSMMCRTMESRMCSSTKFAGNPKPVQ